VLNKLVATGNTVLVIEHNLDVIKTADWVIDMGPEGGDGGGTVVAVGTPEQVAEVAASHTGRFLKKVLAQEGYLPPLARAEAELRETGDQAAYGNLGLAAPDGHGSEPGASPNGKAKGAKRDRPQAGDKAQAAGRK
jgi:excinuclease ABC subunit A